MGEEHSVGFSEAFQALNALKRKRVIRDFAVFGAVAATAHMEPVFTEDLDIIILVESDEEYLATFRRIVAEAEGLFGMHVVLGGVPVQMFPTTVKPLYRDTVQTAAIVHLDRRRVKVADVEHLILLYLESSRQRDKFRIQSLLPKADEEKLRSLLERFDDENDKLAKRLQSLR